MKIYTIKDKETGKYYVLNYNYDDYGVFFDISIPGAYDSRVSDITIIWNSFDRNEAEAMAAKHGGSEVVEVTIQ